MIEELKKRRDELIQAEKEAWANLNVIIGRGAELDFIINQLKNDLPKDKETDTQQRKSTGPSKKSKK